MVANCVQTSSAFTIKPPSSSIPVDGQDRPTPATAANSLRLRRGSLLLRHLLGNGLRRTTGTTKVATSHGDADGDDRSPIALR